MKRRCLFCQKVRPVKRWITIAILLNRSGDQNSYGKTKLAVCGPCGGDSNLLHLCIVENKRLLTKKESLAVLREERRRAKEQEQRCQENSHDEDGVSSTEWSP